MADETTPNESVNTIRPDSNNSEVENLKRQLQEAQSKLGEQSKLMEEQKAYVRDADTLANLIARNPKIQDQLREEYQRAYGGGVVQQSKESGEQSEEKSKKEGASNMADPKVEELTKDVTELKKTTRAKLVKEFEDKAGISSLPREEQAKIRKDIESYVNTFGQSIQTAPVEVLDTVLDKAYKAVNVEKLVQDGKYEGMAELYTNQSGAMPHLSGRKLDVEQEGSLTEPQKQWAEKLGVPVEKVEVINKGKDEEYKRPTKKEQQAKEE